MNQQALAQLIQLKIMDKLGAKALETAEMKVLTEEIAGLFKLQNDALTKEIAQLKQAVTELSKQHKNTSNFARSIAEELGNTQDALDELTLMLEEEGICTPNCDCDYCVQQKISQAMADNHFSANDIATLFRELPIHIVRVK